MKNHGLWSWKTMDLGIRDLSHGKNMDLGIVDFGHEKKPSQNDQTWWTYGSWNNGLFGS